jgi:hypothetical protein
MVDLQEFSWLGASKRSAFCFLELSYLKKMVPLNPSGMR